MHPIQVVYIGAGHVETGGTQSPPLSEGRENIQVVDDAVHFLRERGMALVGDREALTEYRLGGVRVCVLHHNLDLTASVEAVNKHYGFLCPSDWRDGICLEFHFNAPSTTAYGPMLCHFHGSSASEGLAAQVGDVLSDALGFPWKHRHNEDFIRENGGGQGYYWLWATDPLAAIVEMDELHNAARKAIIGDDRADDLYGWAVARVILDLCGVELVRKTTRAIHLGPVVTDWEPLQALRPKAVVTLHAWQIPTIREYLPGAYILWRPWLGDGWLLKSAREAQDEILDEWKFVRASFDGIQLGNEPNLGRENGVGDNQPAALSAFQSWWTNMAAWAREAFPHVDLHTTPLSPGVPDWALWQASLKDTFAGADVLNLHAYWPDVVSYKRAAELCPGLPVVLSEVGRPGARDEAYGRQIDKLWRKLEPWVYWAAPFLYGGGAEWTEWELQGSAAVGALALPDVPPVDPPIDPPALEERVAELERRVTALEGR